MRAFRLTTALAGLLLLLLQNSEAAPAERPSGVNDTIAALSKECAQGEVAICATRASSLYRANRLADAALLYAKACSLGAKVNCVNAGRLYSGGQIPRPDDATIVVLFTRACSGQEVSGCADLGRMHQEGKGLPQSNAMAAAFYKRSCDGGYDTGCNYGRLLDQQLGAKTEDQTPRQPTSQPPVASPEREATTGASTMPLGAKPGIGSTVGGGGATGNRALLAQAAQNSTSMISREEVSDDCMTDLGGELWHTLDESTYSDIRATCNCRNRHYPQKPQMTRSEYDLAVSMCRQEDRADGDSFIKRYYKRASSAPVTTKAPATTQGPLPKPAPGCPDYRSVLRTTSVALKQLAPSEGRTISVGPIVSQTGSWVFRYRENLIPTFVCKFDAIYSTLGKFSTDCDIPVNSIAEAERLEKHHLQCLAKAGAKEGVIGFELPEGEVKTYAFKNRFSLSLEVKGVPWKER